MLAICYGCQLLNVFLGGTLIQDVRTETSTSLPHRKKDIQPVPADDPCHDVRFTPESQLASWQVPPRSGEQLASPIRCQARPSTADHRAGCRRRCRSRGVDRRRQLGDWGSVASGTHARRCPCRPTVLGSGVRGTGRTPSLHVAIVGGSLGSTAFCRSRFRILGET